MLTLEARDRGDYVAAQGPKLYLVKFRIEAPRLSWEIELSEGEKGLRYTCYIFLRIQIENVKKMYCSISVVIHFVTLSR